MAHTLKLAAPPKPSAFNTVMLPGAGEEGLALQPRPPPGGDSRGASAGSLVKAQAHKGWSLADVQVAVPLGQVGAGVPSPGWQPA